MGSYKIQLVIKEDISVEKLNRLIIDLVYENNLGFAYIATDKEEKK